MRHWMRLGNPKPIVMGDVGHGEAVLPALTVTIASVSAAAVHRSSGTRSRDDQSRRSMNSASQWSPTMKL